MIATSAVAQQPKLAINDVRLGFQNLVKPGYWTTIAIDIQASSESFRGTMELSTPDRDLNTSLFKDVFVEAGQTKTEHHFVRLAGADARVVVRLLDAAGRVAAQRTASVVDVDTRTTAINISDLFFVSLGMPAGLSEPERAETTELSTYYIGRLTTEEELPTQWFAYDAVDRVILATGNAALFDRIDATRASALKTWVRQGGRLVVSVANNWQVVSKSFLGEMLPARLTGIKKVQAPEALEAFAGVNARLETGPDGLSVCELADVRGTSLVGSESQPFAIVGGYGLGEVVLLTFDTDAPPFQAWPGRFELWGKLLGYQRSKKETDGSGAAMMGSLRSFGVTDLATVLKNHLENFPDVTVVPFGWVALLIFGYILLIGPIDYLFLKKVVGRLEWTWVTFPTWVIVISVAAYFTAHWLKGNELRINRIDVVDVDAKSGTLRGTGFVSIFSPRIDRYTFTMEPALGAGGSWSDLGMGREQAAQNCAALGLPEHAFGGIYNPGGVGLLGRKGYRYHTPEATALVDVPIKVWSVGSFSGRWLGQAGPVIDANVSANDAGLVGTLTNRLEAPLLDVMVAFGERVYEIPHLAPGASTELALARARTLTGFLGEQTLAGASQRTIQPGRPLDTDLATVMRTVLFAKRTPPGFRSSLASRYLDHLDFSDRLDLKKAILVARVEAPGGRLRLGTNGENVLTAPDAEPTAQTRSNTFLRVLIEPTKASQ